jgi:hypothetical protein
MPAVDMVEAGGAEIDRVGPGVRGVMDGLADLDGGVEVFRSDPAGEKPELAAAVVQVLDVDSADVLGLDHSTSPGV